MTREAHGRRDAIGRISFTSGIRVDLFVSAVIGVAGSLIAHQLDLFERFFQFTRAYENLQLDEFLVFVGLASVFCTLSILRRRGAEQMVRARESHYQLLFERSPQAMWAYDRTSYRILDVNAAAVRQYGYAREQFLAMTLSDLRVDPHAAGADEEFTTLVAPGDVRLLRHRTMDGTIIDVEIRADEIEFGKRPARLVLATDVTASIRSARELERSASLRRATLEATADGIIVFDRQWRVIEWNAKLTEMLGVLPGGDDRDAVQRALLKTFGPPPRAIANSAPDQGFFDQVDLADGRVIERYAQPQRLNGTIEGSVWSLRDVTQRERAIEQRRVIASQFQSAFGAAPIGMCLMAPDGRWLQVNDAMCRLVGRGRDELVGRTSEWVTHPDDRAKTKEEFARLCSGARSAKFEKRYLHSDGSEILALVNATRTAAADGADCFVSQVQDITERRQHEEILRRQALIFETISDAVIMCDLDGRIVDANPVVTSLYGYERHELIGQTARLWQRGNAALFEMIGAALRTRGMWTGEYVFVTKSGRTGIVETTVKALHDADGSVMNFVGVMRDVTERREMERHLLQAQKLEAIGSLAAGIAHEINTPAQYVGDNIRFLGTGIGSLASLTKAAAALADAVRSHAELKPAVAEFDRAAFDVDLEYLLAELPAAAEQSQEGCDRISEIVQAMKRFSHPGSAKKTLVNLNDVVSTTITVSRNEWKYVAELTMDLDPSLPLVPCLPGEFQQVVLNLIVNATQAIAQSRKGSGEMGRITVSTRPDGGWVELRVSDDGCGIPEAIRGKVFDPFFTTKTVGQGTGQGLSIGHATIVDKHHGILTFESEVGRGTTFIIRLPLDSDETVAA